MVRTTLSGERTLPGDRPDGAARPERPNDSAGAFSVLPAHIMARPNPTWTIEFNSGLCFKPRPGLSGGRIRLARRRENDEDTPRAEERRRYVFGTGCGLGTGVAPGCLALGCPCCARIRAARPFCHVARWSNRTEAAKPIGGTRSAGPGRMRPLTMRKNAPRGCCDIPPGAGRHRVGAVRLFLAIAPARTAVNPDLLTSARGNQSPCCSGG